MKKKVRIKIFIIIMLVVIICLLILSNLNKKNTNIQQQKNNKQQLGEITENNTYVGFQEHLSEVEEKEQKLLLFKTEIAKAITEKGVATSNEADATTMSNNIRSILGSKSGGLKMDYLCISGTSGASGGIIESSINTENCSRITATLKIVNARQYGYSGAKTGWIQIYFADAEGNIIVDWSPTTNSGSALNNLEYSVDVDISAYDSINWVCRTLDGNAEWYDLTIE